MTLKEAVESGRRFRRSSWGSDSGYVRVDGSIIIVEYTGNRMAIDVARITATDWEIESIPEKNVTLTRNEIEKILLDSYLDIVKSPHYGIRTVLDKLGLGE